MSEKPGARGTPLGPEAGDPRSVSQSGAPLIDDDALEATETDERLEQETQDHEALPAEAPPSPHPVPGA